MSVMYIVLPLALIFAGVFVAAFIWAVRQGQLDDLETPAARMLFDDDAPARTTNRATQANKSSPPANDDDAPSVPQSDQD